MLQLSDYTEKSKKSLLKAIKISSELGLKYVEPQVLLAGIINEGRDFLAFIMQYINIDRIAFCKKVGSLVQEIGEYSESMPLLSESTLAILAKAKSLSQERQYELIPIESLFLATFFIPSQVRYLFISFGVNQEILIEAVERYRGNGDISDESHMREETPEQYPYLNKYSRNLCAEAREGLLSPTIGREFEIRRMIHILSRQTKNNPILVGDPGTGKTAIVEGLAHRIVDDDIPRELRGITLFVLDAAGLIAGASHVGEFEERLKGVLSEVQASEGRIVLFIDEIHLLIGAGGGAMDAANIMKPELARGKIKVIGATTVDEYKKYIEKDKAFERRFQKIDVAEPDEESALVILRGIRVRLEEFHKIRIKDEAIKAAVRLSKRYIQDRHLPDKAIDVLDEAAAKMKIARSSAPTELHLLRKKIISKEIECESIRRDDTSSPLIFQLQEEILNLKEEEHTLNARWQSERHLLEEIQIRRIEIARMLEEKQSYESQGIPDSVVSITMRIHAMEEEIDNLLESLNDGSDKTLLKAEMDELDVRSVITEWTGIPVTKLGEEEAQKLCNLESYLDKSIIGQEEAKMAVANAIRRNKMGFSDENKPIGSFLFLGSSGVGKTELCKVLAEFLFDQKDAFIRLDMSEYQQEHEVSKLFGAPPGYVGYEAGGQLTDAVRRHPYSIILLDEIEKAHPKVFETLLQVLDDGRMTDGQGRTVDFKNTIIVMTSNLGQQSIITMLHGRYAEKKRRIGFSEVHPEERSDNQNEEIITAGKIAKVKTAIMSELKQRVAPEFLNRIDEIVMFLPLSKDDIRKVVLLQLESLVKKMKQKGLILEIGDDAVDFLAKVGYQPEYGARPVKRAISSFLIDDLSCMLISKEVDSSKEVYVSASQDSLIFTNI